jgi:hypothetical protein
MENKFRIAEEIYQQAINNEKLWRTIFEEYNRCAIDRNIAELQMWLVEFFHAPTKIK